ncbi:hypothetical protein HS7_09940 [Sulfolobales archaeon HS-7]|nr:hypothetical protein HS7_09940 [Sulfolobales archaeon HS-7]
MGLKITYDVIGYKLRVVYHTDPTLVNREGEVILETEKFFFLADQGKNVFMISKNQGLFEITSNSFKFSLDGNRMMSKPKNRITRRKTVELE